MPFTMMIEAPDVGYDGFKPGYYDPATGGAVFTALHEKLMKIPFNSPLWNQVHNMAEWVGNAWGRMSRDENGDRWWDYWDTKIQGDYRVPDTTTYICDAKLGNPRVVDCSQLQYSQSPDSSQSISIEDGITKFLHVDTCNIGISASSAVILTWQQLTAAINGLVEICVNNPLITAIGGRAYHGDQDAADIGGPAYGIQDAANVVGRRRKTKKKRDVTGLNALPQTSTSRSSNNSKSPQSSPIRPTKSKPAPGRKYCSMKTFALAPALTTIRNALSLLNQ